MTVFDGEVVYDATVDTAGEDAIEEKYGVDLNLEGDPANGKLKTMRPPPPGPDSATSSRRRLDLMPFARSF